MRISSFSSSIEKKSSASLEETALCNTFGAAALMLRLDKKYEMHEEGGREGTGVFLYDRGSHCGEINSSYLWL